MIPTVILGMALTFDVPFSPNMKTAAPKVRFMPSLLLNAQSQPILGSSSNALLKVLPARFCKDEQ